MPDFQTVIQQVILKAEKYTDLYSKSEQSVRDQLINPILKTLGWDTSEPDLVQTNVTNDDGKIPDYTLFKEGEKVLVLEAKRLSKKLEDSKIIKQLADYCYPQGIEFGILTDGLIWQLFSTFERNPSKRIVWSIDIRACTAAELAQLQTLSHSNIKNLEAQLHQTTVLNDYFNPIFESQTLFLKWCKDVLMEKFVKENKEYKENKDMTEKYISEQFIALFPLENVVPIIKNDIVETSALQYIKPTINPTHKIYTLNNPLNLKFTKVLKGEIGDKNGNNWAVLLHLLLQNLIANNQSIRDIITLTTLNIEEGVLTENGFCPIEGTKYSLQGCEANRAGKSLLLLSEKYNLPIHIEFMWREKPHAAYPLALGVISHSV
jgi:predicted type IV restriction endonuclease